VFPRARGASSPVSADLDGDGLVDALACATRDNAVLWARQADQAASGSDGGAAFASVEILAGLTAPTVVLAVDIDGEWGERVQQRRAFSLFRGKGAAWVRPRNHNASH